jgi:HAD superfamily hydrolase (TIGR01450 family)
MPEITSGIALFAFDLDGTLYLGNEPVPGAATLVRRVRERHRVVFFTNGSARTGAEVHAKLCGMGIECALGEVYASSTATATYLAEELIDDVFVIGSDGLRAEIRDRGLHVVQDDRAAHVVVGFDTALDYAKVATALTILRRGGKLIACNEDASFPVAPGHFVPGCGAMVGAVTGASERRPDFVVGKPNTYLLAKIAATHGLAPEQIMVVGDSYDSDIAMALRYGSRSILIGADPRATDPSIVTVRDLSDALQRIRER